MPALLFMPEAARSDSRNVIRHKVVPSMSVMKFMYSVVALCERILLHSTEQVFVNTFQKFFE